MRRRSGAFVLVAGFCVAPAAASDLPTRKPAPAPVLAPLPSDWRYEFTGYGWGTNLVGNAGFGPFPTQPFFASFADIIRHFEGGLMGAFIARNGTFIGGLDVIGSRIGAGENFAIPGSPLNGVHADVKLTEWIVTAFGGVRIPVGPPNLELYGTLGARYISNRFALTLTTPVLGFEASAADTKQWVDPVAGFAAHYRIDDKWFINSQADLGGLGSSATGQALGSVGYNWTPSIATTLGYRVLYAYDRDISGANRDFRYQSWMYGPFAGFKYSF